MTPPLPAPGESPPEGDPLARLAAADPALAGSVAGRLAAKPQPVPAEEIARLVEEVLWALGIETAFAEALALGWSALVGEVPEERMAAYRRAVREAGAIGPARGRIVAECLPAVLRYGRDGILPAAGRVCALLARRGVFVLAAPLEALGRLLAAGDHGGAEAFLRVLGRAFAPELTYAESRFFGTALPRAALELPPGRRARQLAALERVIACDRRLAEPFLAGLDEGLRFLSGEALDRFVAAALAPAPGDLERAARFLSLASARARQRFEALQVRVGFSQVQARLQRYLRARTGLPLQVRPWSALPRAWSEALAAEARVTSDAEAVYLPDEIGWGGSLAENVRGYQLLLRLEASLHEFGTLELDLERLGERVAAAPAEEPPAGASDLARFIHGFADPGLAGDLFTVFELGRIRRALERRYPALAGSVWPRLRAEPPPAGSPPILAKLFARIALAAPAGEEAPPGVVAAAAAAFDRRVTAASPVEDAAELVARFYPAVAAAVARECPDDVRPSGAGGPRLATPFGWRPWPKPAAAAAGPFDRKAGEIQAALARQGLHAYRADIRRLLAAGSGRLGPEEIRRLCGRPDLAAAAMAGLLDAPAADGGAAAGEAEGSPAFWYPEWSRTLSDYLERHVLVRERAVAPAPGFYEETLARHGGLVRRTRRAFERLKPEGLKRLRGRPDGDEPDYARLIEHAVARRAGDAPGERLYVKRLPERREVAVLLLVDLSRSTANRVPGSRQSVLEVEKEAIVILCEAIAVLGDGLAVAGFSGTGRLGVDYYRIKGFAEPLSAEVRARIGGLAPQRNTRMGAAIRHAGRDLERAPAAVRLLILLSDGFPNDRDYQQDYALADSRRALMELVARRIRVQAFNVNLAADPNLDELYGRVHHQVIADVRELPQRLIRAYGALTR
jgi:hypothetical protein